MQVPVWQVRLDAFLKARIRLWLEGSQDIFDDQISYRDILSDLVKFIETEKQSTFEETRKAFISELEMQKKNWEAEKKKEEKDDKKK